MSLCGMPVSVMASSFRTNSSNLVAQRGISFEILRSLRGHAVIISLHEFLSVFTLNDVAIWRHLLRRNMPASIGKDVLVRVPMAEKYWHFWEDNPPRIDEGAVSVRDCDSER